MCPSSCYLLSSFCFRLLLLRLLRLFPFFFVILRLHFVFCLSCLLIAIVYVWFFALSPLLFFFLLSCWFFSFFVFVYLCCFFVLVFLLFFFVSSFIVCCLLLLALLFLVLHLCLLLIFIMCLLHLCVRLLSCLVMFHRLCRSCFSLYCCSCSDSLLSFLLLSYVCRLRLFLVCSPVFPSSLCVLLFVVYFLLILICILSSSLLSVSHVPHVVLRLLIVIILHSVFCFFHFVLCVSLQLHLFRVFFLAVASLYFVIVLCASRFVSPSVFVVFVFPLCLSSSCCFPLVSVSFCLCLLSSPLHVSFVPTWTSSSSSSVAVISSSWCCPLSSVSSSASCSS